MKSKLKHSITNGTSKSLKLVGAILLCFTIFSCSQHEEIEKAKETNTMKRFNVNDNKEESVLTKKFIDELYSNGVLNHLEVEIASAESRSPGPTDLQVIVATQLNDAGWNNFLKTHPIVEAKSETIFPSFIINEVDEKKLTDSTNLDMEGIEIQADYIELEPTISKSPMRFGSSFKYKGWLIIFLVTQ